MNPASVKFLLFSLCLHFALVSLFWQKGSAEYGVVHEKVGASSTSVVLFARVVPEENPSARTISRQVPVVTDLQVTPESPMEIKTTSRLAKPKFNPEAVSDLEYVIAGHLTRLPVPITDIDLNEAGINDSDVTGMVELTVLVDRYGTVVDVIPVVEMESTRAFAERVAQRFRIARFEPGEINGKAVNAQLRIIVVSESPQAIDGKSESAAQ